MKTEAYMRFCPQKRLGGEFPARYIPYLRVYESHFLARIYPPKLGCGLCTEYYDLSTTEPATPVLYVVKIPVGTYSG
jgi:hypothetical protein